MTDLLSVDAGRARWRAVRGWLIDLDGVIYRGETLIEGADAFIALLRATRTPFLFLTNNSSRTPQQYASRLTALGIPCQPHEIYTSALATAEYLRRQAPAGAGVVMIGMDGLREALLAAGLRVTDDPRQAQYCVVGYDRNLTYASLVRAHCAIQAGATFIGTNPDPTLPVEGGLVPGNGATLAALATASGVQPTVIGKPHRIISELALARLGLAAGECAMLGDRLDTDIAGGRAAGLLSVLILTGATTAQMVSNADLKPDLVVRDHAELIALWRSR